MFPDAPQQGTARCEGGIRLKWEIGHEWGLAGGTPLATLLTRITHLPGSVLSRVFPGRFASRTRRRRGDTPKRPLWPTHSQRFSPIGTVFASLSGVKAMRRAKVGARLQRIHGPRSSCRARAGQLVRTALRRTRADGYTLTVEGIKRALPTSMAHEGEFS